MGVHRVRCWLDSVDAAVVVRSAELAWAGGRRSSREAEVLTERAAACAAMPEVHAALARGRCRRVMPTRSPAATTDATPMNGSSWPRAPSLVEQAATTSVESSPARSATSPVACHATVVSATTNTLAQRAVSRWTDREGMCHTHISLDPETDARFSAAFDAAIGVEQAKPDDGRTFDQLKADAFIDHD